MHISNSLFKLIELNTICARKTCVPRCVERKVSRYWCMTKISGGRDCSGKFHSAERNGTSVKFGKEKKKRDNKRDVSAW